MTDCRTCELLAERDAGTAEPFDAIHRTSHWDVVHAFDTSQAGWLVLVLRRHVATLAELSEAEAEDLGRLIRSVSRALMTVTGCVKTYVAQFAEHPQHPHVHFHLIPRYASLPATAVGPGIFERLGVAVDERISVSEMNRLAVAVRERMGQASTSDS